MKDNEDSPSSATPMLKLSRVSRKPRKRIAETNAPKPKKRRARKRTDVPIPSFSPVHKLDEMDISILDSPVKPKEEPEEPLVVLLNEENDDDDDDLLDAPPTFAPSQPMKSSQTIDKKPSILNRRKGANVTEQQSQESRDNATTEPEPKFDTDKQALEEAKQALAQADTTVEIQKDTSRNVQEPVQKKKATKKPKVKPDEADLIVAIDGLFVLSNTNDTTEKDFVEALEGQYGAKLYKSSKTFARARLKALIQGTIEPTVSFSPPPGASDGVPKDAPKPKEQRDEAGKECHDDSDDVFVFEDEDGASAITSIQVATKQQKIEPTKSTEKQVVASPEKTLPKAMPKRKSRAPKKPSNVEGITGMDESESKAGTAKQNKPTEKPAPKKKAAPPRKTRAPRAKKGTCALCTTCTCTIGKETNVVDASAVMSRTDAEIERALIRRTQKLERVVDKYETLLDQVNRELKKHRRNVLKKQEAQLNDGKRLAFGDSRFLPDANVWDEQAQAVDCVALPTPIVEEAQATLFSNGDCQITLTQMFGGGNKETDKSTDQDDTTKEENAHSQTVTDEDKEDVVDDTSVVDAELEFEPEPDPVDHIHRVSWRKGALLEQQTPSCQAPRAWSALTTNNKLGRSPQSPASVSSPTSKFGNMSPSTSTSKYDCAWDALFSADVTDDSNDDDSRINQLLDLFENEMSEETQRERFTQESQFEAPLLSQRGENIAGSIEDSIVSDSTQLQSIEAACPKWRDNIRFALAHRGEAEIRRALERVQLSMQALQATKEKVSTVWNRQEVVLKLFEMSLSASLSRLDRPEEESLQSTSTKETTSGKPTSITQGKTSSRLSPEIECEEGLSQSSQ